MKIGIIAAMAEEAAGLKQRLIVNAEKKIGGQVYYDGTLGHTSVTLVQSGIGKVCSAMAVTLLVEEFACDLILNTGSAGGIGEGLSVGDLVLADSAAYHDVDARVFGYAYGQVPQMPAVYTADRKWLASLAAVAQKNWAVRVGEIVSGDSFIADADRVRQIKEHFPKALVTEMEGAAVAQACHCLEVPFLIVRAVSDVADEVADVTFEEFIQSAGKKSADLVYDWMTSLSE